MTDIFHISPARIQDVPIILKFITQLAEYQNTIHDLVADQKTLEESLFGEKPYAEVIIGYLKHVPVSYALFTHNFSTLLGRPGLNLIDLYVVPEARNQGIGHTMLSYLAGVAKKRKCGRLEWCVLKENKPAIKFYEEIGAKAMDKWVTYRVAGETLTNVASEANELAVNS